MMCSALFVIVMLCFLCYVRLFCLMFYVFCIRYFVTKKEKCMSPHSFSYIVCVLTEVCLLVLWVMVVHGSNF